MKAQPLVGISLLIFVLGTTPVHTVRADGRSNESNDVTRVFWQRSFTGSDPIAREVYGLRRIKVLPDGGLVGVGWWERGVSGVRIDSVIWIVRLDASGNLLWDKTFDGDGQEVGRAVAVLPGGDIVFAGHWYPKTSPAEANRVDTLLVRLDMTGRVVWQKILIGRRYRHVEDMTVSTDGGIFLAGSRSSEDDGASQFWVLRLTPDGEVVWDRIYTAGTGPGGAMTVSATADGHVLATGPADLDEGKDGYSALLMDGQGNPFSNRVLSPERWPSGVIVFPKGGYVIVDNKTDLQHKTSEPNIHFERLDENGVRIWKRSFPFRDETNDDRRAHISIDGYVVMPDGSVVVGWGQPLKEGNLWRQISLLRLDAKGRRIWHHRIPVSLSADESAGETLWDMALLPDGQIALTGQTWYEVRQNSWRHDVWVRVIPNP